MFSFWGVWNVQQATETNQFNTPRGFYCATSMVSLDLPWFKGRDLRAGQWPTKIPTGIFVELIHPHNGPVYPPVPNKLLLIEAFTTNLQKNTYF